MTSSPQAQPLTHRRILITRARHQAGKLSEGLRALGADPVEVPVLEIQPPASWDPLDSALRQLDHFDWLIFTSTNTVRAVIARTAHLCISLPVQAPPRIAAVGAATAEALEHAGLRVDFIPESYVAESLLEGISGQLAGKRILLARAAAARDIIPDTLRKQGADIELVDAYQNGIPADAPEALRCALAQPIDAATFTSSSTVLHLAEAAARAGFEFPLAGIPAISIGPITSQTLRDLGWPPAAEADPHDVPGLIAATARILMGQADV